MRVPIHVESLKLSAAKAASGAAMGTAATALTVAPVAANVTPQRKAGKQVVKTPLSAKTGCTGVRIITSKPRTVPVPFVLQTEQRAVLRSSKKKGRPGAA